MKDRTVFIERQRALQPLLRAADVTSLLLRHRELEQGTNIVRLILEQRAELFDCLRLLAE